MPGIPFAGQFSKRSSRATLNTFFDREAVLKRLNRKEWKVLSGTGAFARTVAKRLMKPGGFGSKQRFSQPGQPPRYHTRKLKDLIFFAHDKDNDSVVIGPVSFKSQAQLLQGAKSGAQVLEEGGLLYFPQRKRNPTGYVKARPYMAPTMPKATKKFLELMEKVKL